MKDRRLIYLFTTFVLIGAIVCGTASANTFTNEGVKKLADKQCEASPNYSPDGNKIIFSTADYSADPNQASIWTMDLKTMEMNKVNIPESKYLDYVDWHPNGNKMIFTESVFHTPGTSKIYTINIDGTEKTLLAQDNDPADGHYNPDGSKIVYMTRVSGPTSNLIIWRMDADGSNKIKLTNNNNEEMRPRFSPDGTQIVYLSGVSPNFNIWTMDSDGGNKRQITSGNGMEGAPVMSPDGKYIAYQKSSGVNQPWNVWVMKADGSEQTQLTDYSKDGIDGTSPVWSPDGKKLIFCSGGMNSNPMNTNWDIYEMTLGVKDTTPPTIIPSTNQIAFWPANHEYKTVSIKDIVSSAKDDYDQNVDISKVEITSVSSDELEDALGDDDGNTQNDIAIKDSQTVDLRAERNGNGNGRVYTINYQVSDASGNKAYGFSKVWVPINQGKESAVIDDGADKGYTLTIPK